MKTRHRAGQAVLAVAAIAVTAGGCGQAPSGLGPVSTSQSTTALPAAAEPVAPATLRRLDVAREPQVLLAFDSDPLGIELRQRGSAMLTTSVVSADGGSVEVVDGAAPGGVNAMRFPPYTDASTYPRAILRVTGPPAALDPRRADLEWGADVRLDLTSSGRSEDNGDNVIQRGLSSDTDLFKAEVDRERAACTVRGSAGTLYVNSRHRIVPGWWYRLRCQRHDDQLRLSLTETRADGTKRVFRARSTGPIGSIHFADPGIPLGIGGKLTHDGSVFTSASDQLNGEVASPVVAIGR